MAENREDGPATTGGPNPQRPDADATSAETLEDVEASEKVTTGAGVASESSPLETSTPEPEGGRGDRADGSDAGGPM